MSNEQTGLRDSQDITKAILNLQTRFNAHEITKEEMLVEKEEIKATMTAANGKSPVTA